MNEVKPGTLVLSLNSGSSSLKFGLYRVSDSGIETRIAGEAEAIGEESGKFQAQGPGVRKPVEETAPMPTQREAIVRIGRLLDESALPAPDVIGHRVVHGGPKLRQHCLIDAAVLEQLEAAAAFAPLHTPPALSVIRYAGEHFPGVPQAACFDTSFHAGLPAVAQTLPLPKALRQEGVQRYGFHGLSCESILRQLAQDSPAGPPARVVIAHLGNGASITAVREGKSIDTSMGLTPSGGVIMGTRSGDLDPGILVYLMREKKLDAAAIEQMVDHHSGLLGLSGIASDMRKLHRAAESNDDARLAIEMFCYSVRKQIAAMIAALGGIDLIVFTGGIGEHDAAVRSTICGGLSWLGIGLDESRNQAGSKPISEPASRCRVLVLPSQEDEQIARHAWALLPGAAEGV